MKSCFNCIPPDGGSSLGSGDSKPRQTDGAHEAWMAKLLLGIKNSCLPLLVPTVMGSGLILVLLTLLKPEILQGY